MPRRIAVGLLLILALGTLPEAARADISYQFQSNPSLQNGYNISGYITTDGSSQVSARDILAWQITVTQPSGSALFSYNSTTPNAYFDLSGTPLVATSTTLNMPFGGSGASTNTVLDFGLSFTQNEVEWASATGSLDYVGTAGTVLWDSTTNVSAGSGPFLFTIAAVPEPSSFTLVLLGMGAATALRVIRSRMNDTCGQAGPARQNAGITRRCRCNDECQAPRSDEGTVGTVGPHSWRAPRTAAVIGRFSVRNYTYG
jgi:hypothetical protein